MDKPAPGVITFEITSTQETLSKKQTFCLNYEFLHPQILQIVEAIPFASEVIDACEKLNRWEQASVANAEKTMYDSVRNNSALPLSKNFDSTLAPFEFQLHIVANLGVHILKNKKLLDSNTKYDNYGFEVLKYNVGQHFNQHIDLIDGHPVFGRRKLSAVGFLNDNFEGGELRFPQQQLTIKPTKGNMIFFPPSADFPHASLDVISGIKYSVVSWFYA